MKSWTEGYSARRAALFENSETNDRYGQVGKGDGGELAKAGLHVVGEYEDSSHQKNRSRGEENVDEGKLRR